MYPFERFTDPAKSVLRYAQEEAERASHSYIGTEHLLLGLMRVEEGVAAQALASLGVEVAEVRRMIVTVLGRQERVAASQIIPTSRVKKVIELAFGESLRGNRPYVGTGQLVLALAMESEGIAAHVLKDLGADYGKLANAVAAVEGAGVSETASELAAHRGIATVPVGAGARVLVHDPEPPHRLWEGRVTASGPHGLEVEVPDRPAGVKVTVDPRLIHPVPTGPTLWCRYCIQP